MRRNACNRTLDADRMLRIVDRTYKNPSVPSQTCPIIRHAGSGPQAISRERLE